MALYKVQIYLSILCH